MGLELAIGHFDYLAENDRAGYWHHRLALFRANLALLFRGMRHREPQAWEEPPRRSCFAFPYWFLANLKRAYCCAVVGEPVRTGEFDDETDLPLLNMVVDRLESHLVCHSDTEGFYVPIDFKRPIVGLLPPGGAVGSSQALLRELAWLAPRLGITLQAGRLSDMEATLLEAEESGPLYPERQAWFSLWECASMSVQYGAALEFA